MTTRLCTVPGCERQYWARGCCVAHYERLRTTGDTRPNEPIRPWAQASPAKPVRTVEIHTFPRLRDEELAGLFGIEFRGDVAS